MANSLYDFGRENFLGGDIDWDASNIKINLLDGADYTRNIATDDALNDIPAAARVATSGNLASKTKTAGTADAADVTLTLVTGDPSEMVACYKDTGTESTSLLIANWDTSTGLPITPNGADINVIFNASGLFKI